MKRETLVWQIIVLVLGLASVLTAREYLLDKNEIEAETAKANCIIELKKIKDSNYDVCASIETYKLKFNEW
jgi:hypothetical protein